VLMLDMSGSTVNFRQQLKLASQRFLDALAPEDRVAVIQFNKDVKSLSGFLPIVRRPHMQSKSRTAPVRRISTEH